MSRFGLPLALALIVAATAQHAQAETAPTQAASSKAALDRLAACRAQTDSAARLACYDETVAGLLNAEKAGDLIVVDKETVTKAQRESFGLNLPSFSFGQKKEAAIAMVESTIREARKTPDGWRFVLEDGARWEQVDSETLPLPPRVGAKVTIRRAALGSYMLTVNGRAIRVERVN
ncbi:hypothetical protein [Caulobacter endophyticus]|uniref:hypothetical protein n=1 Tax=Caulobacter endophyticus TaxID=2172652 RepID=UPI00240F6C94|nr:hypothetical protein [Caulobacter endophyticus]MDG2530284.1 hypothetical protein [Caulobacter endophyticus]